MKRIALLCALLAAMLIQSASAKPNSEEFALPPFTGGYEPLDDDERGLWMQIDEFERNVVSDPNLIRDERLIEYLQTTLCNSVGMDRCEGTRIHVVRAASFNAGMYPNGMMIVHTGALLRLRNEAELASLLGHEFAHFEKRHGVNGFKSKKTTSDIIVWASFVGAGRSFMDAMVGSFMSYKRDQEREADLVSAAYLQASPYASSAAAEVWVRLMDEDAAQAKERNRRKLNRHAGWLDSHPAPYERAKYLSRIEDPETKDGDLGADRYAEAISPYLLDFFDDQLQRNDFAGTSYMLEQMAAGGWTADLLLLRGELYRKRGNPRDLVTAAQSYQDAIEAGCQKPEVWRGLGLAKMRSGAMDEGRAALRVYLEKAPDAPDAKMMKAMEGDF